MAHRSHLGSNLLVKHFSGKNQYDPTEFSFSAALRSVAERRSSSIHSNSLENLVGLHSVSK